MEESVLGRDRTLVSVKSDCDPSRTDVTGLKIRSGHFGLV
jgi:hypothetical protein